MYRIFLALRYLWSRPISWISMVGIWLSVMALIVTISVMSGLLRETVAMIRGITPDLLVTSPGPEEEAPPFDVVAEELRELAGITRMTPRLIRPGMLRVVGVDADVVMGESRYSEQNFVRVIGVDPEHDTILSASSLRGPETDLVDRWPSDTEHPFFLPSKYIPETYANADYPTLLIGSRKFNFYGMKKGDRVALVTLPQDLDVESEIRPLSQRFLVGGAVATGHPEYDLQSVYLHLADARRFAQAQGGYSEIGITVDPALDPNDVKPQIEAKLAAAGMQLEVETWRDRNREFLAAVETERVMLSVLLFFFVAVACFNVFATVTVMVTDKTRDIGVLNAMGATRRGLLEIFVLSGLVTAILSSTLGCLSGVVVATYINALDGLVLRIAGVSIFPDGMYAFSSIPVELQPRFILLIFVSTVLLALVCAFIPALRAARLDPVEALRTE